MKLGEVLIAEGVINGKHLKDALDTQLRFGGHLGTCLVELGYVSEERLADALARSYGVPYVPAAAFRKIPRP